MTLSELLQTSKTTKEQYENNILTLIQKLSVRMYCATTYWDFKIYMPKVQELKIYDFRHLFFSKRKQLYFLNYTKSCGDNWGEEIDDTQSDNDNDKYYLFDTIEECEKDCIKRMKFWAEEKQKEKTNKKQLKEQFEKAQRFIEWYTSDRLEEQIENASFMKSLNEEEPLSQIIEKYGSRDDLRRYADILKKIKNKEDN